jgi:pyruvate/2-oxoglutarate/acetoin dehydrogenase E1 component
MPIMKFTEAIQDAYLQTMRAHPDVFLVGVGLIDPKAVFGTLEGLYKEFGDDRIVEGPLAEQMLTGLTFGAATNGLRPVLIHHRVDFLPLTFDQIANHMAKCSLCYPRYRWQRMGKWSPTHAEHAWLCCLNSWSQSCGPCRCR